MSLPTTSSISILLIILYVIVLVACIIELAYSYKLFKEGKLSFSFRFLFFVLTISLCLARITQFGIYIGVTEPSLFLQLKTIFRLLGNTLFFSAFVTILLLFAKVLKFSHHEQLKFSTAIGVTSAVLVISSQLALLITLEARFPAAIAYFDSFTNHTGHAHTHVQQEGIGRNPIFAEAQEYLQSVPANERLHDSVFLIDGIFCVIVGVAFIVAGAMLYQILKKGESSSTPNSPKQTLSNHSNHSHHSTTSLNTKISLAAKMLGICVVVGLCMITRLGFAITEIYTDYHFNRAMMISVEFIVTELIPVFTFLAALFTSRYHIQTEAKSHSRHNRSGKEDTVTDHHDSYGNHHSTLERNSGNFSNNSSRNHSFDEDAANPKRRILIQEPIKEEKEGGEREKSEEKEAKKGKGEEKEREGEAHEMEQQGKHFEMP